MEYEELKYEFNQMTIEDMERWFYRNYGESLVDMYGKLSRIEYVNQLANDNSF